MQSSDSILTFSWQEPIAASQSSNERNISEFFLEQYRNMWQVGNR